MTVATAAITAGWLVALFVGFAAIVAWWFSEDPDERIDE